ncbi:sugar phosphate isomerase/epimerase [Candidatus Aerophobetes bacterium]|nr:sugar phosphate isomerase/epimerase [Candidatus Aerophobetes bacterium]
MSKAGVHLLVWTINLEENLAGYFEKAKLAGADGIEIPVMNPMELDFKITQKIARNLERFGLECTCGGGLGRDPSLINEHVDARKRGRKYLRRYVDICVDMNSHFLAGVLYGGFEVSLGRARNENEWLWAVEGLQEVAEYAKEKKVTLCLEVINRYETYFLNTAEEGIKLVKDINRDNVKLHLDTYHMNIEEKNFYTPIIKSKGYLGYMHCCENDRGVPGTGHVHWDEIFKGLAEIEYDGWLVIESFYGPVKQMPIASSVWRKFANSPDEIAIQGLKFIRKKMKEYDL